MADLTNNRRAWDCGWHAFPRSSNPGRARFCSACDRCSPPSRPEDPDQEIIYGDGRTFQIRSGTAVVEEIEGVIYLAISLRNVGAGLGVLQKYDVIAESPLHEAQGLSTAASRIDAIATPARSSTSAISSVTSTLPAAISATGRRSARSTDDLHVGIQRAIADHAEPISVDLLYGDHQGGQLAIIRFNLVPGDDEQWVCSVVFHWIVDGTDPRDLD